jgi:hypothetical protein
VNRKSPVRVGFPSCHASRDGKKLSSCRHTDPSDRNRSDTVASVGRALFGTTATSGADSNQTVTDSHGDFPTMMSETGSQKKIDDSYTQPKVGP